MKGKLSKIVSESKSRLGRPRVMSHEKTAEFARIYNDLSTGRSLQNKHYLVRAIHVLGFGPRYEWLGLGDKDAMQRGNAKLRQTLLTALGRITDDEVMRDLAGESLEQRFHQQGMAECLDWLRANAKAYHPRKRGSRNGMILAIFKAIDRHMATHFYYSIEENAFKELRENIQDAIIGLWETVGRPEYAKLPESRR